VAVTFNRPLGVDEAVGILGDKVAFSEVQVVQEILGII
jgi:hypothetical protein